MTYEWSFQEILKYLIKPSYVTFILGKHFPDLKMSPNLRSHLGYSLSQPFTHIILSEKILSDKSLKIQD